DQRLRLLEQIGMPGEPSAALLVALRGVRRAGGGTRDGRPRPAEGGVRLGPRLPTIGIDEGGMGFGDAAEARLQPRLLSSAPEVEVVVRMQPPAQAVECLLHLRRGRPPGSEKTAKRIPFPGRAPSRSTSS